MSNNFGDYISSKRKEKKITLRRMADMLEISAAYWSDIEKGRRNPPNIDKIADIANLLELTLEETDLIIDMASEDRDEIPMDLPDYIKECTLAKTALRKARKAENEGNGDLTKKAWEDFIKVFDN